MSVVGWSEQYGVPCITPGAGETVDELIELCRMKGAFLEDDGEEFCLELRPDVGPELWTERALRATKFSPKGPE